MQAGAADQVPLDHAYAQAQLRRPQRTGVTSAARTEYQQIELTSHAAILPGRRSPKDSGRAAILGSMGWLRRAATKVRKGGRYAVQTRSVDDAVTAHLSQFAATRRGVEAFVEPKTSVTETTLLLVAFDGEWTRRVVPSPEWAHAFAEHLQIPGYDAAVVGYPQRMRDYNSRNKKHPDLR